MGKLSDAFRDWRRALVAEAYATKLGLDQPEIDTARKNLQKASDRLISGMFDQQNWDADDKDTARRLDILDGIQPPP
jgi:hypothetical protein